MEHIDSGLYEFFLVSRLGFGPRRERLVLVEVDMM